ncbi:MAG: Gfo/Idh/MocA family oxidoreductase [Bacteroidota bacterium]
MSSFAYTEPVRLAQIGTGYWGEALLRNAASLPGAEMVAVCDPNGDALDAAGRQVPRARLTQDEASVLADPSVEAVIVASAPRAERAEAALDAGKHVLVWRTLAPTSGEAAQVIARAEAGGRQVMVGHVLRYHPAYRRVEALAREGALGAIRYVSSVRAGLGPVGFDALNRLAPHDLAFALAIVPSVPVTVSATAAAFRDGPWDIVSMTVTFAGGETAHLRVSRIEPQKIRRTTVVGTEATASVDDLNGTEPVRVHTRDTADAEAHVPYADALRVRTGDVWMPLVDRREPLRRMIREFVACVREDRAPRTGGADGLAVVRVLEAALQSVEAGGTPVAV